MATLLPDCAMRVRRVALPLSEAEKEEKVSFCEASFYQSCVAVWYVAAAAAAAAGRGMGKDGAAAGEIVGEDWDRDTYGVVQHPLVARVVVDVDRHAAQGRDFGGQLVQARVVLPVARALASSSRSLSCISLRSVECVGDWRRRRGRAGERRWGNEAPMRCAAMRRYALLRTYLSRS